MQAGDCPSLVPDKIGFEPEIFFARAEAEAIIVQALTKKPIFFDEERNSTVIDCKELGSDLLLVLSSKPTKTTLQATSSTNGEIVSEQSNGAKSKTPILTKDTFTLTLEVYLARIVSDPNTDSRTQRVPGHRLAIDDLDMALVELPGQGKKITYSERNNVVGKQFCGLNREKSYAFIFKKPEKDRLASGSINLAQSSMPPVEKSGSVVAAVNSPQTS